MKCFTEFMYMTFTYVTFTYAPEVNLSLLFRHTQKEQAECEAAEAPAAAKAAQAAEVEEVMKATATAKVTEEQQKVQAAEATKAVKGKAVKSGYEKPETPITDPAIHPSPSPGSDDFEYETPKRKLNPHSLNYPSSGRSTPPVRARVRPCKEPQPPSEADKPVDGSKEELLWWQKKYNAATWHYKNLMSIDAESYHESENARVKERLRIQCQHIIHVASGSSAVYKHIPDTPKSVAHEKICQRQLIICIIYIKYTHHLNHLITCFICQNLICPLFFQFLPRPEKRSCRSCRTFKD